MAEKDITEKVLMSYADVFADCVNALVYDGKQRLRGEELLAAPTESFYYGKGKMRNQFCDKSFYRMEGRQKKVQYIIENETQLSRRQILRKASYQGGAYREQLEQKEPVYPIICIVLDWTYKRSRIPRRLHRLIEWTGVYQEEAVLVDDMNLTVYRMRNLPGEMRERFTSDMGFVVDYLNEGSLEGRREQKIIHVEALCGMMEAVTKDRRFTELAGRLLERGEKKEGVRMCEYLDMLEARGQERGEKIGQERGEKIGQERGEKIGQERGEKIGEEKGENRFAKLINKLMGEKKYKEIQEVSNDKGKRRELYRQYGIL